MAINKMYQPLSKFIAECEGTVRRITSFRRFVVARCGPNRKEEKHADVDVPMMLDGTHSMFLSFFLHISQAKLALIIMIMIVYLANPSRI